MPVPRFTQIAVVGNHDQGDIILALDEDGRIWTYEGKSTLWNIRFGKSAEAHAEARAANIPTYIYGWAPHDNATLEERFAAITPQLDAIAVKHNIKES